MKDGALLEEVSLDFAISTHLRAEFSAVAIPVAILDWVLLYPKRPVQTMQLCIVARQALQKQH